MERRVVHAERLKDAFGEELFVRLAGGDFDDAAADVDAWAVLPFVAGLKAEGAFGEGVGSGFERDVALLLADEAGGVGDELCDGEAVDGLAAGEFGFGEGGDVFLDGVVVGELAFFFEDHQCGGGDRLGHRHDAEEGVGGHRLLVGRDRAGRRRRGG